MTSKFKSNQEMLRSGLTQSLYNEKVKGLGHTCFDGVMHLQSLINETLGHRKIFAFRKHPYIQIISGLKDPDQVLTVNLKIIDNPDNHEKEKREHTNGLRFRHHTSRKLR